MDEYRLPNVILNWDFICICIGWLSDMSSEMERMELPQSSIEHMMYDLKEMNKKGAGYFQAGVKRSHTTNPNWGCM